MIQAVTEQIHQSFDFKIKKETIDGTSAVVQTAITSVDFEQILQTYQEELSKWLKTSAALAGGSEGRRQKEYELLLSCMEQNKAVVSHDVEIPLVNDGVNWKIQMTPEVSFSGCFWRCAERTEYGFGKQKLIAQNEKHKKRVPPGAAIMATSRGTLFFCSFILLLLLPVHEWQCPVLPTAFRLQYPAPLT